MPAWTPWGPESTNEPRPQLHPLTVPVATSSDPQSDFQPDPHEVPCPSITSLSPRPARLSEAKAAKNRSSGLMTEGAAMGDLLQLTLHRGSIRLARGGIR